MIKTCIVCGKEFKSSRLERKYCSEKCKAKAYNRNKTLRNGGTPQDEAGSICWRCIHAVPNPEMGTGCSWSRSCGKTLVNGCEYQEKVVYKTEGKDHKAVLKMITKCPKYQWDTKARCK